MRNLFYVFILIFTVNLCFLTNSIFAEETQLNQNGRYQISASRNLSTLGGVDVYLLDTQTGMIWMSTKTTFGGYTDWYQLPLPPIQE